MLYKKEVHEVNDVPCKGRCHKRSIHISEISALQAAALSAFIYYVTSPYLCKVVVHIVCSVRYQHRSVECSVTVTLPND